MNVQVFRSAVDLHGNSIETVTNLKMADPPADIKQRTNQFPDFKPNQIESKVSDFLTEIEKLKKKLQEEQDDNLALRLNEFEHQEKFASLESEVQALKKQLEQKTRVTKFHEARFNEVLGEKKEYEKEISKLRKRCAEVEEEGRRDKEKLLNLMIPLHDQVKNCIPKSRKKIIKCHIS